MPELPEVETMVRGIRPSLEGRTIRRIQQCRCRYKPIAMKPPFAELARRLHGVRIAGVRRLAKRIVMDLASHEILVIEPRMTGLMLLANPPDRDHLRLAWHLDDEGTFPTLWFWDRRGLGTVSLYSAEEFHEQLGSHKLGPDALAMSPADWHRACAATTRAIKVALLDQTWVAGIGNLYASEILNEARLSPWFPADQLSSRQIGRLAAAVQQVLRAAIDSEGSTLSDGTYRNALNQDGSYQNKHRVYGRSGEVCPACRRGRIRRAVQVQRSTFYCPVCQRSGPGRP